MARKRRQKRRGVGILSALSLEGAFLVGIIAIAKPDILADFLAGEGKPSPTEVQSEDSGPQLDTYQASRILPP